MKKIMKATSLFGENHISVEFVSFSTKMSKLFTQRPDMGSLSGELNEELMT